MCPSWISNSSLLAPKPRTAPWPYLLPTPISQMLTKPHACMLTWVQDIHPVPRLLPTLSDPVLNSQGADLPEKAAHSVDSTHKCMLVEVLMIDTIYWLVSLLINAERNHSIRPTSFKNCSALFCSPLFPMVKAVRMAEGGGKGEQTERFNFSSNTVQIKIHLFE